MRESITMLKKTMMVLSCLAVVLLLVISIVVFVDGPGDLNHALDDLNSQESKEISSNVWLHWTASSVFTVNDREGVGLVNGNILRAGYLEDRKFLALAFVPFAPMTETTDGASGRDVRFAKIELSSSRVVSVATLDMSSLEEVRRFFDKH